MSIEYLGLNEINGPLVVLEGVQNASFEEIVEIVVDNNEKKLGRIVELYEDKAVIQVFEGNEGMSLKNTHTKLTGHPMELAVSLDILGRTFNGIGQPIDGLGDIYPEAHINVNGLPLNPVTREYPRNYIRTGISAIDGLTTLIRGQKLPIFSGNGLPHDRLAAQIVKQASLGDNSDEKFAIVFAAMGVKYDVAEFFRKTFEESGVSDHVVMYLNLANDPVVERLITPKVALTAAEYLAFEKGMHILVILTDMTSFAEAMREVSSSKGEIPSRKGYPGYLYSEFATLYERAGIVKGGKGSVTQIPILTMPNDDITHPIPDLTGYITEGQIVFDFPDRPQPVETSLTCPRCKEHKLKKGQWYYECECGFRIGHTVAQVPLSEEIMHQLFTEGRTRDKVTGFVSKAGNSFDAVLKYEDERIQFDFDARPSSDQKDAAAPMPWTEEPAVSPTSDNQPVEASGEAFPVEFPPDDSSEESMSFADEQSLFADSEEDGLPWN